MAVHVTDRRWLKELVYKFYEGRISNRRLIDDLVSHNWDRSDAGVWDIVDMLTLTYDCCVGGPYFRQAIEANEDNEEEEYLVKCMAFLHSSYEFDLSHRPGCLKSLSGMLDALFGSEADRERRKEERELWPFSSEEEMNTAIQQFREYEKELQRRG